jgi:hypothetical protein
MIMKKTYLILIVLLIFQIVQSQEPCSKGSRIPTPLKQFRTDVENNNVRLYILGGFIPAVTEADRKFEEKYKVHFHDFGCTPPPLDYYKEYNVLAFAYLKEKYGDAWQKEIRTNILGWDEWKQPKVH